uniref:RRM_8 domain-containing protein n=1 Tax=Macrostomum lignano TaxID=282301 RepID=A0A1I8FCQ0_9PLAT
RSHSPPWQPAQSRPGGSVTRRHRQQRAPQLAQPTAVGFDRPRREVLSWSPRRRAAAVRPLASRLRPPPQPLTKAKQSRLGDAATDAELLAPPVWPTSCAAAASNTLTGGVFSRTLPVLTTCCGCSRNDLTDNLRRGGRASAPVPTPHPAAPLPLPVLVFFCFHPVYLSQLTYEELFNRITSLFQADGDKISQVLVYGPTSIAVCITDEWRASQSTRTLHVQPDLADPGRFRVFMRERRHHCAKGGNSAIQCQLSRCSVRPPSADLRHEELLVQICLTRWR